MLELFVAARCSTFTNLCFVCSKLAIELKAQAKVKSARGR